MWEIKSPLSVVTNAQGLFCSCAKNLFLKLEVGLYKVIYGEFVVVNTHWTAANTLSPICVIVQPFLASFSPTNEGRESGVSLAEQWNSVKQSNNKIRTTCAHVHIVITIFILLHTMLSIFSVEQMLEAAFGGSYKILIKADSHTLHMIEHMFYTCSNQCDAGCFHTLRVWSETLVGHKNIASEGGSSAGNSWSFCELLPKYQMVQLAAIPASLSEHLQRVTIYWYRNELTQKHYLSANYWWNILLNRHTVL